ncbi:MAG: FkbM family methyltransferase, partial [Candidatus Woesearchaeota archaeon]
SSKQIHPTKDLMLQMDIEGGEYDVLTTASLDVLKRFRIIIIEFHDMHYLFEKNFFNTVTKSFKNILKTHEVVHIHPNNMTYPVTIKGLTINPLLEITFLRKDRVKEKKFVTALPHVLDKKNVLSNKEIPLSKEFYFSNDTK